MLRKILSIKQRFPAALVHLNSAPRPYRCHSKQTTMASASWGVKDMPDLAGRTFVVVGASSGLGFEAAKQLAAHNAHVVLTARSSDRGEDALKNIRKEVEHGGKMDLMTLDVADFNSVQGFVEEYKAKKYPIHGLINNAGIFLTEHAKTEDGFEITMKTNHYGLFLLATLLVDVLKQSSPSRMVWVASPAETFGTIDWDDLRGLKDSDSDMNMYGRTKLMNIMTSNEFQKRLHNKGVESFACHPGVAKTDLYNPDKGFDKGEKLTAKVMDVVQKGFGQSEERGALSLLYTATEPALAGHGGKYYGPNNLQLWNTAERGTQSKEPWDEAACARLFDETRKILEECIGKPLPSV